jgi:hypothetical protein
MQPITPTVVRDIVDDNELRELWIVGREFERPPWFHAGKGGDTRLARALRVVQEGRITPNSDGSYTVEGSEGRTYRCDKSCSCPQSQKGPSKHCYHMVSVALYVEWQRRLRPYQVTSPVALGTLRAGTAPLPREDDDALGNACTGAPSSGFPVDDETLPLPLPPVTVEERLALSTMRDSTALSTNHTPQEDLMTEDAEAYIPEPDDAPVAVADAPVPTPRPLPGPVLLPSLDARTLEQSMQAWSAQRQVVKRFLQQELVEGVDFYTLRIKGRETKPALSKAGSEKFLALFQLHAVFEQDTATWTMLGEPQGTLCYRCQLHTRSGEIVGEGRGARTIQQDGGDINKAVKMGQKSACVDAILRTGALSDVFTQDLEPGEEPAKPPTPAKPTSQDLRARIWAKVQELAPEVKTREACEAYIKTHTGMTLHPDLYEAIAKRLDEGGR